MYIPLPALKPIKVASVKLNTYNILSRAPLQPLVPSSHSAALKARADALAKAALLGRANTLLDPGINPVVARRIEQEYGIQNNDALRTTGQVVGGIAGGIAGVTAGMKIGASAGLIAGNLTGIGAVLPEELITVPLGAIVGAIVGLAGTFTGAAVGGAILSPTGWIATGEIIRDTVLQTYTNPGAGAMTTLSVLGNTMDQAFGAPIVKSAIVSLQEKDTELIDTIFKSYGVTDAGFTQMDFSRIRKNFGWDVGTAGNFIIDFIGELATDPGMWKLGELANFAIKGREAGARALAPMVDDAVARGMSLGQMKKIGHITLDAQANPAKSLQAFRDYIFKSKNLQMSARAEAIRKGITYNDFVEELFNRYGKAISSNFDESAGAYNAMLKSKEAVETNLDAIKVKDPTFDIEKVASKRVQRYLKNKKYEFTTYDYDALLKHYPAIKKIEAVDDAITVGVFSITNPLFAGAGIGGKKLFSLLAQSSAGRAFNSLISKGKDTFIKAKDVNGRTVYSYSDVYKDRFKAIKKRESVVFEEWIEREASFKALQESDKEALREVYKLEKEVINSNKRATRARLKELKESIKLEYNGNIIDDVEYKSLTNKRKELLDKKSKVTNYDEMLELNEEIDAISAKLKSYEYVAIHKEIMAKNIEESSLIRNMLDQVAALRKSLQVRFDSMIRNGEYTYIDTKGVKRILPNKKSKLKNIEFKKWLNNNEEYMKVIKETKEDIDDLITDLTGGLEASVLDTDLQQQLLNDILSHSVLKSMDWDMEKLTKFKRRQVGLGSSQLNNDFTKELSENITERFILGEATSEGVFKPIKNINVVKLREVLDSKTNAFEDILKSLGIEEHLIGRSGQIDQVEVVWDLDYNMLTVKEDGWLEAGYDTLEEWIREDYPSLYDMLEELNLSVYDLNSEDFIESLIYGINDFKYGRLSESTNPAIPYNVTLKGGAVSEEDYYSLLENIYDLEDAENYLDRLEVSIQTKVDTSVYVDKVALSSQEFMEMYAPKDLLDEWKSIRDTSTKNEVNRNIDMLKIQNRVSDTLIRFQVNQYIAHTKQVIDTVESGQVEQLYNALLGKVENTTGQFNTIAQIMKDIDPTKVPQNVQDYIKSLRDLTNSNKFIYDLVSDPRYIRDLADPTKNTGRIFDALKRLNYSNILEHKKGVPIFDEKAFSNEMVGLDKELRAMLGEDSEWVDVIKAEIRRRYEDIQKFGEGSVYIDFNMFRELDSNLATETWKTLDDVRKLMYEAKLVHQQGVKDFSFVDPSKVEKSAVDAIWGEMENINALKTNMVDNMRGQLRATNARNNSLKMTLFTPDFYQSDIIVPQLFNPSELVSKNSPYTLVQPEDIRFNASIKRKTRELYYKSTTLTDLTEAERRVMFGNKIAVGLDEKGLPLYHNRKLMMGKASDIELEIDKLKLKKQSLIGTYYGKDMDKFYEESVAIEEQLTKLDKQYKALTSKFGSPGYADYMIAKHVKKFADDSFAFHNAVEYFQRYGWKTNKSKSYEFMFNEFYAKDPNIVSDLAEFSKFTENTEYLKTLSEDELHIAYARYKSLQYEPGVKLRTKSEKMQKFTNDYHTWRKGVKDEIEKLELSLKRYQNTETNKAAMNLFNQVDESVLFDYIKEFTGSTDDARIQSIVEDVTSTRKRLALNDKELSWNDQSMIGFKNLLSDQKKFPGEEGKWNTYDSIEWELKRKENELYIRQNTPLEEVIEGQRERLEAQAKEFDITKRTERSKIESNTIKEKTKYEYNPTTFYELKDYKSGIEGRREVDTDWRDLFDEDAYRADTVALENEILDLKRAEPSGIEVTRFEYEKGMDDFDKQIEEVMARKEEALAKQKELHRKAYEEQYGHFDNVETYKNSNDLLDLLVQGDIPGFRQLFRDLGYDMAKAEEFIEEFMLSKIGAQYGYNYFFNGKSKNVLFENEKGNYKITKEYEKDIINFTLNSGLYTPKQMQLDLKMKMDFFRLELENYIIQGKYTDETGEFITKGAVDPKPYAEYRENVAKEIGEDLPLVAKIARLDDLTHTTLKDLMDMFDGDADEVFRFLKDNDEYVLVAVAKDSTGAARTSTKYYEGRLYDPITKKMSTDPTQVGTFVKDKSNLGYNTANDAVEYHAFMDGKYDVENPAIKQVTYKDAEDIRDLWETADTEMLDVSLMSIDGFKTAKKVSYKPFKLPVGLDYYYKYFERLQKSDLLISTSFHPRNFIDVLRKNSQMLEGVWQAKDYLQQGAKAVQLHHHWNEFSKQRFSILNDMDEALEIATKAGDSVKMVQLEQQLTELSQMGIMDFMGRYDGTSPFLKEFANKNREKLETSMYRKLKFNKNYRRASEEMKKVIFKEEMDDFYYMLDMTNEWQKTSGSTDQVRYLQQLTVNGIKHSDQKPWHQTMFTYLAQENPVMKANMRVGSTIEQAGRLHGYLLDRHLFGTTHDAAVAKSLKRHFDYSDRGALEMYTTLVFPFVAFPTRNMMFWSEQLMKASQSRRYYHFLNAVWGGYDGMYDSEYIQYAKSSGYIPLGNSLLKLGDSRYSAQQLTGNPAQTAQSRLNPLLKLPMELLKNSKLPNQEQAKTRDLVFEQMPLLRRIPQVTSQIQAYKDNSNLKAFTPGIMGTLKTFNNPAYRNRRDIHKELFTSSGQYRTLSNNAYYRTRQVMYEQQRRRYT